MLQTSLVAQTYKGRGGNHKLPLMYGGINFLPAQTKTPPNEEVCKTTPALYFAVFALLKLHGTELKQPAHDFKTITIFKITANQITINKI